MSRMTPRGWVGGGRKKFGVPFVERRRGSEQVVAEISFLSSPKMIAGVNCHRATRRARDHPYLAHQLSDGEIWTVHGGVNPCGLVVRRGDRKLRT
jgi:hypothetical protein